MREISDKALTFLVFAALAVSLMSTFVSVTKLTGFEDVTGRVLSTTGTGQVNLTVSADAFVNVTDNFINFSSMAVGQNNWSEQLDYVAGESGDFFEVQNAGSLGINISLYATGSDSGLFASTTTDGCDGSSGVAGNDARCIYVRCNSTTNVSAGPHSSASCATTFAELGAAGTETTVFTNLTIQGRVNVSLNVTVPNDEPSGVKSGSIIILGEPCTLC